MFQCPPEIFFNVITGCFLEERVDEFLKWPFITGLQASNSSAYLTLKLVAANQWVIIPAASFTGYPERAEIVSKAPKSASDFNCSVWLKGFSNSRTSCFVMRPNSFWDRRLPGFRRRSLFAQKFSSSFLPFAHTDRANEDFCGNFESMVELPDHGQR